MKNFAVIEHKSCKLRLDTSLLDQPPLSMDSLYQIIGELCIKEVQFPLPPANPTALGQLFKQQTNISGPNGVAGACSA